MIKNLKNLIRRISFYLRKANLKLLNEINDNLEMTTLRKDGVIFVRNKEINDIGLKEIINYCFKVINEDDFNKKCEKLIDEKKNNNLNKKFKIDITNIFDKKILSNLEKKSLMSSIAKKYFKKVAYMNSVSITTDIFISNSLPLNTQIFHRDGDSFFILKFFIYLSKVDENSGPFQYLKSSHVNNDEFSKKKLENKSHKNLLTFCGNIGDMIIADTNGYHKGKQILKNGQTRFLLTFMYSDKALL